MIRFSSACGTKIIVDETSLELLGGSTVDYVDDLAEHPLEENLKCDGFLWLRISFSV